MDFAPLYQALLSLWYLIPLFVFAGVVKSAWFKGVCGEFIINVLAKWKLDKDVYHLIKNVTLPTENGTTQIDHIIVSVHGVFVVETKNRRGWIYGSRQLKMWTQKIYINTYRFQNPLHQNYKHSKTLQALLNLEDQQVHSVVVFIGDSTFKTPVPVNVTFGMDYIRYIQSMTETVLSPKQVREIIEAIENGRLKRSMNSNRAHKQHVQQIINSKDNAQLCPKSGSEMLLRETKKGDNAGKQFWGCSAFPKCRTIRNI